MVGCFPIPCYELTLLPPLWKMCQQGQKFESFWTSAPVSLKKKKYPKSLLPEVSGLDPFELHSEQKPEILGKLPRAFQARKEPDLLFGLDSV